MDHDILARAADVIRRSRRIGVPLDELVGRVGGHHPTSRAVVERALRADPAFRVLDEPAMLPGLASWTPDDQAAYRLALGAAGLSTSPLVVLVERTPRRAGRGRTAPPASEEPCDPIRALAGLLHDSLVDLIGTEQATELAQAADRTLTALRETR